jgi:hypothetical protein
MFRFGNSRHSGGWSFRKRQRRKGSLNLVTDLSAELSEKITVREAGRPRRVSKQRALIKSLMAKALQGDVRASAAVLALYARVGLDAADDNAQPVDTAEFEILRRFAPRLLKAIAKKA